MCKVIKLLIINLTCLVFNIIANTARTLRVQTATQNVFMYFFVTNGLYVRNRNLWRLNLLTSFAYPYVEQPLNT